MREGDTSGFDRELAIKLKELAGKSGDVFPTGSAYLGDSQGVANDFDYVVFAPSSSNYYRVVDWLTWQGFQRPDGYCDYGGVGDFCTFRRGDDNVILMKCIHQKVCWEKYNFVMLNLPPQDKFVRVLIAEVLRGNTTEEEYKDYGKTFWA